MTKTCTNQFAVTNSKKRLRRIAPETIEAVLTQLMDKKNRLFRMVGQILKKDNQ